MANILYEVQQYVVDKLNANPALSACPFLAENKKNIDFEIKNALAKQGIVGLVLTPRASFAGAFMDVGLAWQLDELEIDIVENVPVNRGKQADQCITGQDAAMAVFSTLCPLSGENEGQFSPVSYSQGEDGSLLVNKDVFKCLVHPEDPSAFTYIYGLYDEPKKVMWRGEVTKQMVEDAGLLSADTDFGIKFGLAAKSIGFQAFEGCQRLREIESFGSISAIEAGAFSSTGLLTPVVLPAVDVIRDNVFLSCSQLQGVEMQEGLDWIQGQAFSSCSSITELVIPSSVTKVGYEAFRNMPSLTSVMFLGKTPQQLHDLKTWGQDNYPWGITDTSIIHTELAPTYYVDWTVQNGSTSASFGNYHAGDEIVFTADEGYRYVQWRLNDGDEYTGDAHDGIWTYTVQDIEAPQHLRVTFNMYEP